MNDEPVCARAVRPGGEENVVNAPDGARLLTVVTLKRGPRIEYRRDI